MPPRATFDLEPIIRGATAFGITCYVVGLLIANSYLYSLGFSDFALFSPKFVIIGIVFLCILGVFAYVSDIVIAHLHNYDKAFEPLRLATAFVVAGFTVALVLTVRFDFSAVVFLASVSLFSFVIMMTIFRLVPRGVRKHRSYRRSTDEVVAFSVMSAGMVAMFGVLTIISYSRAIYPSLPEQLGGAMPKDVALIIHEHALPEAVHLRLDVSDRDLIAGPVRLYWESESTLIVGIPQASGRYVAQIDRSMVAAVVVDPHASMFDPVVNPAAGFPAATPNASATPLP